MNNLSYKRNINKFDKGDYIKKKSILEKVLTKGNYEQKVGIVNITAPFLAVNCLYDFENKKYYTEQNAILLHNRIVKSDDEVAIINYLDPSNTDKQFIYNENEAIVSLINTCNNENIYNYFSNEKNKNKFRTYQTLIEKKMLKTNKFGFCSYYSKFPNANKKTLEKLVLLSNKDNDIANFLNNNKVKNIKPFNEKAIKLKSDKIAMAIMNKDKKYHTPELINLVKNSDNQYVMEMALDVLDDNEIDKHKLANNLGNHISKHYSVQDTLYNHPIEKFLSKYGKYLTKEERNDFYNEDARKQAALEKSIDACDYM